MSVANVSGYLQGAGILGVVDVLYRDQDLNGSQIATVKTCA